MGGETMPSAEPTPTLLGRRREREQLDRLLRGIRSGDSQVLVLRGLAGVGKTALLQYLQEHAAGCLVARCAGVESEMELAYAGLHQLCGPFLDRSPRLPVPQREALETIFGTRAGHAPDRFMVGLAVLSLLAEVGEPQPLVCIVDDVQWLDRESAQTLAFVARRLAADPVALVFAARDGADTLTGPLAGLPELELAGLADSDARKLLESAVPGPLDPRVRDRMVAETRGNPLALLELPRTMSASELTYGLAVGDSDALVTRIEQGFLARMRDLPEAARQLLLLAASEPAGDVNLLWRAAASLGVTPGAAVDAQRSGLLDLAAQVRFRHPLVRSAAYRGATPQERHRAHRALAEATDPVTDPDRSAWHRGHATSGLDEAVAAELEASAGRARARGGMAAAAAFLGRATELSPDPDHRSQRALAAATAKLQAGDTDEALVLVAIAEAGPLGELDQARAQLLRAQVAFAATRGREAPALLLAAARRLERLDATLAKETYLDALAAAVFAGRLAHEGRLQDVAGAVLEAGWGPACRPLPGRCDLLLQGVARLVTGGYAAGAPALRQALSGFREGRVDEGSLRWLWLACRVARALGDDAAWDELTDRQVHLARRLGALEVLPIALTERFSAELFTGHLSDALAVAAEAEVACAATGAGLSPHIPYLLAAWRGDEAATKSLLEANRDEVSARGEGLWLVGTDWTSAVFLNSLGRYDDALAAAERAAEFPDDLGLTTWVLPELVEAAVRSGQADRARAAMRRLLEVAAASDTDWLGGVAVRSQALLQTGPEADRLYRHAIDRLGRTRIRVALARGHLLYGEWLRREGRRVDARQQLRTAHDIFIELGMEAFTERTRRELVATGANVRTRSVDTADQLTAQEAQIARLAIAGRTNPEIGAELFLSPRTVEWHLRKVFTKLDVRSRKELAEALGTLDATRVGV